MTLGQLRTFLAVAATGSVRAAAEQLVVTQPAVSAALAGLRREVGTALVTREGRGLRLTPAGEVFADRARQALALLDEAVAAAQGEAGPGRGRLRLATVTTAGERLAPALLASFLAEHPGVSVTLEVGNRRHVWDLLAHHEADLAIGGRPPAGAASLAVRPNQLVAVGAASGGKGARSVSLDELAAATWLLREPGSGTRAAAEELLGNLGIIPRVLTLGSNGAVLEGARIGLGLTLVSRDAVVDDLTNGVLEEWRHESLPLERPWHLVSRADDALPATSRRFLTHLLATGWCKPGA